MLILVLFEFFYFYYYYYYLFIHLLLLLLLFFIFIFYLEFIIYRLFLFPISPLVRQVIPLSRFFQVPPPPVTCLLVLLFLFISTYYLEHCPFQLGKVVQEIEIVQKAFC